MRSLRIIGCLSLTIGASIALSATALAQDQAQVIEQPADFAVVRARFEGLTPEQVQAAGYAADPPACVSHPELGGMGVHAVNAEIFATQLESGEMDPDAPPFLLLDATLTTVVGLEWSTADIGQDPPELFGQTVHLAPGNPAVPEEHYEFHAYFKPNGRVLFATWDPDLACPMPNTAATRGPLDRASGPTSLLGALLLIVAAAGAVGRAGWKRARR
jgi:hypothetical protein